MVRVMELYKYMHVYRYILLVFSIKVTEFQKQINHVSVCDKVFIYCCLFHDFFTFARTIAITKEEDNKAK